MLIVGPHVSEGSALGETSGLVKRLKRMLPAALYEVLEFLYSVVALWRLARAAARFRPDAIYERYNLHLHAGRFVARALGVKLLLEVNAPLAVERAAYGNLRMKRFADWSDRLVWRGADYVLPVTDALADFVRAAGVPEERIVVIPNGVDLDMYPAAPSAMPPRPGSASKDGSSWASWASCATGTACPRSLTSSPRAATCRCSC